MRYFILFLSLLSSQAMAINLGVAIDPEKHQVGQQFTLSVVFSGKKCAEIKSIEAEFPKTIPVIGKSFRDLPDSGSCKYNWVVLEQVQFTGFPKINFEWSDGKKDSWSFASAEDVSEDIVKEKSSLPTIDPEKKKVWNDLVKAMPYVFFPRHENIKIPKTILRLQDCRVPLDQVAACIEAGSSVKVGCPVMNMVSYRGECDLQSLDITDIKNGNIKDYSYQVQNVKNVSKIQFKMKFSALKELDKWQINYQMSDGMVFDTLGVPVLEFSVSYSYQSRNNGASFTNSGGTMSYPDPYGRKSTSSAINLPLESK